MLILDQTLLSETSHSSYQQALKEGYRLLRFEPHLESEFRQFHAQTHLLRQRFAGYLAACLYLLFVGIDFTTLPAYVARWTIAIRVGLIIPTFMLAIWATYTRRWRSRMHTVVTLAAAVAGLGTEAIIGVSLRLHHNLPYEGILLLTLFVYFIIGLGWWRAIAVNVLIFVGLLVVESLWQPNVDLRIYHAAFMFTANIVGAMGSYFLEYSNRTTFLVNLLLRELAERDGLTGLYNRRTLNGQLGRVWRQAQREGATLALAMIDVDFFKTYNDRYGHAEGDRALQSLATLMADQALRPLDLAARYGGEEFVLIWYAPDPNNLAGLGERLRKAVFDQQIPHADSPQGVLTVTIGLAQAAPAKGGSTVELLRPADAALYQGKQQGRNRCVLHAADANPDHAG